jgi:putative oxidoreductase
MDELNLGLLILRVLVGVVLALHGIAKFRGGIKGVGSWFESEGLKPGLFQAWLAGGTEIGAGLAVAAGFLFPFSNMAFVGVMAVAGYIGHRKNGFFIIREGWEYTFVLAGAAGALAATGPGEWSIDNSYDLLIDGWAGLIIAVGGGIAAAVVTLALFYRPPADKK